jgi:hypothetical protein
MTDAVREWVVYQPPKSAAFGHNSKPRDPRLVWPKVETFLSGLADVELGRISELICDGPSKWTDAQIATVRMAEARQLMGREAERSTPDSCWKLSESQIAPAVQFALDDDKFPKQEMGPTRLHVCYSFLWPEFERLPYWMAKGETRRPNSDLGVTVGSGRLFLQPAFVFPAPWNSEILRNFITHIGQIVPFRFRDQYFKRWLPPRGSAQGRRLNLPKNWREPIITSGS